MLISLQRLLKKTLRKINKEWWKHNAYTTLLNIKMEQMLLLINKGTQVSLLLGGN